MAEHIDDAMKSADEAIAALKRARSPRRLLPPALARSSCNGRSKSETPRRARSSMRTRQNGISNGSNGAQPVQGEAAALSDELIDALARGTVKTIAAVVKPLKERIAKLEDGGGAWREETYRGDA